MSERQEAVGTHCIMSAPALQLGCSKNSTALHKFKLPILWGIHRRRHVGLSAMEWSLEVQVA